MTRTMKASEFKAKCLSVLDEVQNSRATIVLTKRGRPVAQIGPVRQKPKALFGAMRGSVVFEGDIVSPVWDDRSMPKK